MAERKKRPPVEKRAGEPKSFEDHLESLEGIVAELEKGELPLEASIEKYREGLASLKACYEILNSAQRQVEELTRDVRGALETRPFEGEGAPAEGSGEGEPPF